MGKVLCIDEGNPASENKYRIKKGEEYPYIEKAIKKFQYKYDPDNYLYYCLFNDDGAFHWFHSCCFIDITDMSQEDIDEYKKILKEQI